VTTGTTGVAGSAGQAANARNGARATGPGPLTPTTLRALEAAALDVSDVLRAVRAALDEDFRYGPDVTSAATVAGRTVSADMVAREAGVVAGLPVALAVFDVLADYLGDGAQTARGPGSGMTRDTSRPSRDLKYPAASVSGPRRAADGGPPEAAAAGPLVTVTALVADGTTVAPGDAVLRVSGDAVAVLGAERTMLNFVTHLSGIASATRQWADAVAGTRAVVRDTRKTLPGLRSLQKYAVRCGGGENHRMGLGDAALVKDNHVAAAGGIAAAVRAVRAAARTAPTGAGLVIEVECDSIAQVREALDAGARFILLDNMPVPVLREAVAAARAYDGVRLEASGGLKLANAREVAATGVDYLSVGGLTHSSGALDLGLDYRGA
jgi:nicotinate-nucleotide pyrophosphorylase (carboxylating)